jgi:hypothetical protein
MPSLVEQAEAMLHSLRGPVDPNVPAVVVPAVTGSAPWDAEAARQLVPIPQAYRLPPGGAGASGMVIPYATDGHPEAVAARADAPPPVPPPPPGYTHNPYRMPKPYAYDARQVGPPVYPYSDAPSPPAAAPVPDQPEPVPPPVGPSGVPGISAAQRTGHSKLTVAQLRAICDGELDL